MLAKFVLLLSVSAVFLDAKATPNVTSTYNFYPTKWAWRNISYSIHGYPMNQTEITPKIFEQVVKKAFDAWEEVADIHFYRIKDGQKANIPVSFEQQQHGGKGHPGFRNESIAHGKWPNDSYVHLNENRNWTLSPATYENPNIMYSTMHEIGHALGIDHHNPENEGIMGKYHMVGLKDVKLFQHDINAIQILYGLSKKYLAQNSNTAVPAEDDSMPKQGKIIS